jgi:hypothetical protein
MWIARPLARIASALAIATLAGLLAFKSAASRLGPPSCSALGIFVDLAGEETLTQRAIWNEADSESLEPRDYFCFWASPTERVTRSVLRSPDGRRGRDGWFSQPLPTGGSV